MVAYRLYCLTDEGHIASADWIVAENDEVAVHEVRRLRKPHKCEIWFEDRLVAEIPGPP
jgi:hypothetical protein